MKSPRFFSADLGAEEILLEAKESKHARVLRLKEGSRIVVFNQHTECEAEVVSVRDRVRARIVSRRTRSRELAVSVTAACAVPKGRRLEFMVQKLAELGAARFVPVRFGRSVARLGDGKRRRCEQISVEAAKQCGRSSLMKIDAESDLGDFLAESFDVLWVGSPDAEQTLLQAARGPVQREAFVVGPEGGLTDDEEARLVKAGAVRVRLAPTILRVETAALAFMSTLAQIP